MTNDRTFLFAPEDENEAQALLDALEGAGVSATLVREGGRMAVHVPAEARERAEETLARWMGDPPPPPERRRRSVAPMVMAALLGVSLAGNLYLWRRVTDAGAPALVERWPNGEIRTAYTLSDDGDWVQRWRSYDRRGRLIGEGLDTDGDGVNERVIQRAGRLTWVYTDADGDGNAERLERTDARGGHEVARDRDGDGHLEQVTVSRGGERVYETRDADADGIYERMVFHGGDGRVVLEDRDLDGFLEHVRCDGARALDLTTCELER